MGNSAGSPLGWSSQVVLSCASMCFEAGCWFVCMCVYMHQRDGRAVWLLLTRLVGSCGRCCVVGSAGKAEWSGSDAGILWVDCYPVLLTSLLVLSANYLLLMPWRSG